MEILKNIEKIKEENLGKLKEKTIKFLDSKLNYIYLVIGKQ
jgi:hypothetical protein